MTSSKASRFDVVGIGNAMVDMLTRVDNAFVSDQGLIKGSMNLIDDKRAEQLTTMLSTETESAGGSAANTMAGLASFGSNVAYIGKVSNDRLGRVFANDMESLGVSYPVGLAESGPATGRCLILVTPDAQRTLNTYLGMSSLLEPQDVPTETVSRGNILFCEGYLWDMECSIRAIRTAMDIAIEAGNQVALALSDTFCVERHHQDFLDLVAGPVDIVFANVVELEALYEAPLPEAIERVRNDVGLACVTKGAQGSMLVAGDQTIEIEVEHFGEAIDTTGAGDQYAAGVLYGITTGRTLSESGRLGSLAAAEVVAHMGPRPHRSLAELVSMVDQRT